MKPAPFEYLKARSLAECLDVLAVRGSEAKILSGGQSLVPLMNLRLARPDVVVDVNGLADLAYVRRDDGVLEIGALARHGDIAASAEVEASCPLVAAAASQIGYPAIRARGTIGGSIAHADPAAELPCASLALGADIVVRDADGERRVPADEFFLSHFTTVLAPFEIVVAVRFPVTSPAQGWGFEEFARKTGDFAVVCVGVLVMLGRGSLERVAIAVSGLGGRPMRVPWAEASLVGHAPSEELAARMGAAVAAEVATRVNEEADGFRPHLAGVLARRAFATACTRAGDEGGAGGR